MNSTSATSVPPPPEKFALLIDLGTILVPDDTSLNFFRWNYRTLFQGYNDNITDKNFPHPGLVLKPRQRLWVRAFKQSGPVPTTYQDRIKFLIKQRALLVGVQGISLVWQKREQLPVGYWYAFMNEKNRLWADPEEGILVPGLEVHEVGGFGLDLRVLDRRWEASDALFCFCRVPKPSESAGLVL